MENLVPGLHLLADPIVWIAMALGTLYGTVVGVLPGLGPVVGITICLPFTFSMDQTTAIMLLLGVYCGATYGGAITAVLINTPGTPQSAATCFDGFPLTLQGRGGEALGWATMASVLGGLFSCFVLIFAAPQLAAIALKFGPVETFALITLALTCIATISQGSMVRGLLAGFAGLFFAAVGADPMTGDVRFTFGFFALSAGIELIPMIVGAFALSEVFIRCGEVGRKVPDFSRAASVSLPSWQAWKPRLGVLGKASIIGSLVGVLPGTGAATASFISYAEAKRSSPRRDRLGTGEPDGIIASEAANNAVTGGALVPTLALGIPGDPVTAVMMTTMVVHGITPGVRLMAENGPMVYAMFVGLVIINVMMLGWGILVARASNRLLRLPEPLLMAMVVILCLLGSYGVRGNAFDLVITLAFGGIGYFMRLFQFPIAPMVIGMVLGPQFEMNLRRGLIVTDGSFTSFFIGHPIAVGLCVVTVLILGWPLIQSFMWRRKA